MKKFLAFMLLAALCLPAAALALDYSVTLPAGYDSGDVRYGVVYVLPQDGYAEDDSGIRMKLAETTADTPMLIVQPAFGKDTDVVAEMEALVAEIDADYRTIADPQHRAVVGTNVGGYLAYVLGLTDGKDNLSAPKTFGLMASIRGSFAENPWKAVYGDIHTRMEEMHLADASVFDAFYTYMDAPVDDALTNQPGSTNDMGALFIGYGTGSAAHEYTVRPGAFDDAFLSESVRRVGARLAERMCPAPETAAPEAAPARIEPQPPMKDGDRQILDLSGDWQFQYVGQQQLDAAALTKDDFAAWHTVQPTLGNWTSGYGNISVQNVASPYGPDYFDYFIVGAGYYARTFTVPQDFDAERFMLSVGYVDDRCEVFLNGVRIGATGLDAGGQPTGETTWAVYSAFPVEAAQLNIGGENTVVVRAWNDVPMGAGGWYAGPVALYSEAAFAELNLDGYTDRFYEERFESACAARALGEEGTIENKYIVHLPESYFTSDRRYPTVYLLHQFNSDHTSYKADQIDRLLDEGAQSGAFDEMIVVIPNSAPESWWSGEWEKMITDELIPLIDSQYRTIRDARYRLTMGCSMGGQGAMAVALRHPNLFTGAVSFYGAFSYGGASSPNVIAEQESDDYLRHYALAFICGNQDSYGFGVPAIALNQQLARRGIEHFFLIDNGGHDSGFYVPYFADALGYVRGAMYESGGGLDELLTGSVSLDGSTLTAEILAGEEIAEFLYLPPDSRYTKAVEPTLSLPVTLTITQGDTVCVLAADDLCIDIDRRVTAEFDVGDLIDPAQPFTASLKAYPLDQVIEF